MKSYTNISQSKTLNEILPLESADKWYSHYGNSKYNPTIAYEGQQWFLCQIRNSRHDDIPCWSLAALLGVLPQSIIKYIENERCKKIFHLNLFRSYYCCISYDEVSSVNDDNSLYCIGRDNWIDACYEMILKLHELKML